jgi:hypothetical protein
LSQQEMRSNQDQGDPQNPPQAGELNLDQIPSLK